MDNIVKMKDNLLKIKSYRSALSIVNLYKYLREERKEFVLSKEILRRSTYIGAMMLREIEYLSNQEFESINFGAIELIKRTTASIKIAKSKFNHEPLN
jgi:hypothetical protein